MAALAEILCKLVGQLGPEQLEQRLLEGSFLALLNIEDACGVPSPHPSTPCQEQAEFTAEMVADRCETTAEKQALSAECCKLFRRELCLLLPLLLPLPAGTMQRKLPKVTEK